LSNFNQGLIAPQVRSIDNTRAPADLDSADGSGESLQQSERQMLQSQKLDSLTVMAGGIAHDFNNILTGILNYCDLAEQQLSEPFAARRSLGEIRSAALRAAQLTAQMLHYTGHGRFVAKTVHLQQIVEQIRPILEASLNHRAVVQYYYPDGLPPIEADPVQIRQVIMSLAVNAFESLDNGEGLVAICVRLVQCSGELRLTNDRGEPLPEGSYICLEVRDNGCGIEPKNMSRIFEPFFTTKFTGRGLGLAAVQGIVRSHHGAIRVESMLGKGSVFRIYLPVESG
jgi:signal transduction histidine kinase